jgi:hypothetical protein
MYKFAAQANYIRPIIAKNIGIILAFGQQVARKTRNSNPA